MKCAVHKCRTHHCHSVQVDIEQLHCGLTLDDLPGVDQLFCRRTPSFAVTHSVVLDIGAVGCDCCDVDGSLMLMLSSVHTYEEWPAKALSSVCMDERLRV